MNRFILMLAFFVLAIIAPVSLVNTDVIDHPPGEELTIDVITVDAVQIADIVITPIEFEKTETENIENVISGGDCWLCGKQIAVHGSYRNIKTPIGNKTDFASINSLSHFDNIQGGYEEILFYRQESLRTA